MWTPSFQILMLIVSLCLYQIIDQYGRPVEPTPSTVLEDAPTSRASIAQEVQEFEAVSIFFAVVV